MTDTDQHNICLAIDYLRASVATLLRSRSEANVATTRVCKTVLLMSLTVKGRACEVKIDMQEVAESLHPIPHDSKPGRDLALRAARHLLTTHPQKKGGTVRK